MSDPIYFLKIQKENLTSPKHALSTLLTADRSHAGVQRTCRLRPAIHDASQFTNVLARVKVVFFSLAGLVFSFSFIGQAYAMPTADVAIYHSWQGDLRVDIGVGNPASPLWETNVWNYGGGSADNVILYDVDISGGSPYLWNNTWYLEVYDGAGQDSGYISDFRIHEGGNDYVSPDHPGVYDYQTSYAYIQMPSNPSNGNVIPEPATLALMGLGLVGLGAMRRRKTA